VCYYENMSISRKRLFVLLLVLSILLFLLRMTVCYYRLDSEPYREDGVGITVYDVRRLRQDKRSRLDDILEIICHD